jgi:hypothetical protein
MPNPDSLLAAAGVIKVVEQTWRLDSQGPTGNSSARIGERPRIEATSVQQAREGEAWLIARGRYEHLMVARTAIPDVYRDRARGIVALARSLRPAASIPGARSWAELETTTNGALVGVGRHLALPPSAASPAAQVELERDGGAPLVAGYRLRLAVITTARHADVPAATALIREGQRQGLDPSWLLAVAARHWPPARLWVRAWRGGRRWATSSLRRRHQPRQPAAAAATREARS